MKPYNVIAPIIIILTVVIVVLGNRASAGEAPQSTQRLSFEYKLLPRRSFLSEDAAVKRLNSLGADGWIFPEITLLAASDGRYRFQAVSPGSPILRKQRSQGRTHHQSSKDCCTLCDVPSEDDRPLGGLRSNVNAANMALDGARVGVAQFQSASMLEIRSHEQNNDSSGHASRCLHWPIRLDGRRLFRLRQPLSG